MAASTRQFLRALYEEYLEEASFLYEQRLTLYQNPEVTWLKIGAFEDRLEAHIDGLVVGDTLALEVCARHAAEGDFGELFAAAAVFCRQDRRDLVLAIFDQLDPEDTEKTSALADALKYELPDAWANDFLTLLDYGDPKLAPILARIFGYRRTPSGPQLLNAMARCPVPALPEVVWALGRIRHKPAVGQLLDYLKTEEQPVRSAAAVALARIGDSRALDYCLDQAHSEAWSTLPLGLAGGRRELALLTDLANKTSRPDCFIALGLLGDPAGIPLFLSALENPETAPAAATALYCIMGAALSETVFIPDEIDEDELFESEREQLKQGKPLDRGDGRPFGSNVTRLAQNPADWTRWWKDNGSRFTPGIPYRNGSPLSPARLVDMLTAETTPHDLRKYGCDELVIRYAKDLGLEPDMHVSRQTALLAEAATWAQSISSTIQEGTRYFAGTRRE